MVRASRKFCAPAAQLGADPFRVSVEELYSQALSAHASSSSNKRKRVLLVNKTFEEQYQESSALRKRQRMTTQDEYRAFAEFFIGKTTEERVNRSGALSHAWEERAIESEFYLTPQKESIQLSLVYVLNVFDLSDSCLMNQVIGSHVLRSYRTYTRT